MAAWTDWTDTLDGLNQAPPPVFDDEVAPNFDLFDFLRQDAAAGAATEVAC
jgi:hypothetical protein